MYGVPARGVEQLSGFDEAFRINYNDVDFCLRARQAGYRVVLEAGAVLVHDECSTRAPGTTLGEREMFLEKWSGAPDPFYSPSLIKSEEIALQSVEELI